MTELDISATAELTGRVLDQVEKAVVGKRNALGLILSSILSRGHVLLEDFPGLGKTLAARSFAQTLGIEFRRAQFTPDLLPGDLTGSFIYDQRTSEFVFRRGPLFTGVLLADEINRTPPKTQAALLEAMQEGQITVEGETFVLARPFHVLATANPVEYEGTYPLPEAQLDRFLMRVSFGLSHRERGAGHASPADRPPPGGADAGPGHRRAHAGRHAGRGGDGSRSTTAWPRLLRRPRGGDPRPRHTPSSGSSPRGSLALMLTSRAYAVIDGRDYVTPEDVKAVARVGARAPDHDQAGALDEQRLGRHRRLATC